MKIPVRGAGHLRTRYPLVGAPVLLG